MVRRRLGINTSSGLYRTARSVYREWREASWIRSYSEYGEDRILAFLARSLGVADEQCTYLDIGAGRPRRGSNTYWAYRLGGSGIVVDPIPANCRAFRRVRPRDSIRQCIVTDAIGEFEFFEFYPYEFSTFDFDRAQELTASTYCEAIAKYRVRSETIPSLLRTSGVACPFLLSIDAEGADSAVVSGNDWAVCRPSIVCIEERNFELEESYVPVTVTPGSWIYLAEERFEQIRDVLRSSLLLTSERFGSPD